MLSNHLILCRPLLLPPSIWVFSNESVLPIGWRKHWSFSFNVSPSDGYSELISFRIDWFDFLAVQGTLKSLLQHHSSKASILQCSALFIVQHWHSYLTTRKTIALTKWTFIGKVMSLLFHMLVFLSHCSGRDGSRLVITFLPRSKGLLISWLQSPSVVILEPPKNKVCHCFPIYFPRSDGTRCHELSFLNVELSASFFTLLFHFHQEALNSSSLSAIRVVSSAYLRLLIW